MYNEHGEKCGKLLACIARGSTDRPTISSLESPSGSHISDQHEILNTFSSYYDELYFTHTDASSVDIEAYLAMTPLPVLSDADRESLDCPITVQEIL